MLALLLAASIIGLEPREDPAPRPLPAAAHNCYPTRGQSRERLVEALRLGIDNIEIDVGWDAAKKRLVVTHEAEPKANSNPPEFEAYLLPPLLAHWKTPRPDKAPTVLTIDWKTDRPEAVAWFKDFLDRHPDWFSSATKTKTLAGTLTERRLTVCLTGSELAKDRYDALIPAGGEYRAFRDVVHGGGSYDDDLNKYAPKPATTYHRFVTIAWGNVERGGPALSKDWTKNEQARLAAIVKRVHDQGFRVRFYCLNKPAGLLDPYAFSTISAARLRWLAARRAGADWIASDNYMELVEALKAMKD